MSEPNPRRSDLQIVTKPSSHEKLGFYSLPLIPSSHLHLSALPLFHPSRLAIVVPPYLLLLLCFTGH